jgi:hypothetical protein
MNFNKPQIGKTRGGYFLGCAGRISIRLTMVRAGMRNTIATASATSSGAIIQLVSPLRSEGPPENPVSTLPGMMVATRTFS